jgi:hypothetical protein
LLVERDEAGVARAAFSLDELKRIIESGVSGRLETDASVLGNDEGADCPRRLDVIGPS